MIYFHRKDGELPPIRKLVKGKPHLGQLLRKKGTKWAMQTVGRS